MMSVLHGNGLRIESVLLCELAYLRSIVIGHQKIAFEIAGDFEQRFVIDLRVRIEVAPGDRPRCWGVYGYELPYRVALSTILQMPSSRTIWPCLAKYSWACRTRCRHLACDQT